MSYELFIEPDVHELRKQLPGNIRQRIKRIIDDFAANPRPTGSRRLVLPDAETLDEIEIWRFRLEQWRIVYAVNDTHQWVRIMSIRRRPPYNYQDIPDIIRRLAD